MGLPPAARTPLTSPAASHGAAPASLTPWGLSSRHHSRTTRSGGKVEVVPAQWSSGQAQRAAAVLGAPEQLPRQPRWLHWSQPGRKAGGKEGGRDGLISLAGAQASVGGGRSGYCQHLKGSCQGHHGGWASAMGIRVPGRPGALPDHAKSTSH